MDTPITARAALLHELMRGKGYGLDLIERVRARTKGEIVLGQGSIYPTLRDLEYEGLVRSHESEPIPERGGRPRRYYTLTAKGQRAALEQGRTVLLFFGEPSPEGGTP
jgi:PadR family transcriptional regulator